MTLVGYHPPTAHSQFKCAARCTLDSAPANGHPRIVRVFDPVTLEEAARILGCSKSAARRLILKAGISSAGRLEPPSLSREAVEHLALSTFRWREHLEDLEGYWISGQRAADVLDVNVARLNRLAGKGFVPFELHADGTRLYRREQLQVVGQSREARWR